MITSFRNPRLLKKTSMLLLAGFITELVTPLRALALTSGPTQPEVQQFTPVETSEMVNLFTGDFSYNIPLLDVGGYPVNLAYNANISMDEEASWVGLGWNVNPGAINRDMRALPDDFKGDVVKRAYSGRDHVTVGASYLNGNEIVGLDVALKSTYGVEVGAYYNNFTGVGIQEGLNVSWATNKTGLTNLGFSLGMNSDDGLTVTPTASFGVSGKGADNKVGLSLFSSIGLTYSTRDGLQQMSLGLGAGYMNLKKAVACVNNTEVSTTIGGSGGKINFHAGMSFAYASFTPDIGHPYTNSSVELTCKLGPVVKGVFPYNGFKGYMSKNTLSSYGDAAMAFGYMYLGESQRINGVMLDYNREKDGPFTKHKPNLALAQLSYDMFSLSGQGIGGNYRLHRSDVGMVYDYQTGISSGSSDAAGAEFGEGEGASKDLHVGTNVSSVYLNSFAQAWGELNDNEAYGLLAFQSHKLNSLKEPAYFKKAEELIVEEDADLFDQWLGTDAARFTLNGDNTTQKVESKVTNGVDPNNATAVTRNRRNSRVVRQEPLGVLTNQEAALAGVSRVIENYNQGFALQTTPAKGFAKEEINRVNATTGRQPHHLSQLTSVNADGVRYIYGIPVYNKTRQETSFSIKADNYFKSNGERNDYAKTGICTSYTGDDVSVNNRKGFHHAYESTTIPAYPHAYLLTLILSPEYVDVTGDGPTDDDLGSYTKLNYVKAKDNYQWRVPYQDASYNPGLLSKYGQFADDQGSILFGQKEIWYLHSIVTKTHVAEFKLDNRFDGWETGDQLHGGLPASKSLENTPLKKLKEIVLYAKHDLENSTTPTPLKVVHFVYDYSLCKGLPNYFDNTGHGGGKLTLKKVYFTYGDIYQGVMSPYKFTYADSYTIGNTEIPFKYDMIGSDRWGTYRQNNTTGDNGTDAALMPVRIAEYPYADQRKEIADQYARAWKLEAIELPSGGKIKVEYEADDYAYVQDKRAMQMLQVAAAGNFGASESHANIMGILAAMSSGDFNSAYDKSLYHSAYGDRKPHNVLFFSLQQPIDAGEYASNPTGYDNIFQKNYILDENGQPIKDMYYKFLVELTGTDKSYYLGNNTAQEYISGYGTLQDAGICPVSFDGQIKYGWVKLKNEKYNSPESVTAGFTQGLSPVTLSSWNFLKSNFPQLANNHQLNMNDECNVKDACDNLIAILPDLMIELKLFTAIAKTNSSRLFAANSMIRLYNPVRSKIGGGARVKKLLISDQWAGENSSQGYDYGQAYTYTQNENGREISSGVASYEPIIGGDENPFRLPIYWEETKVLAPDPRFMHETPLGESFFPAPIVGYSKVTVKNIAHSQVTRNATGKIEYSFYTERDFPTQVRVTRIAHHRSRSNQLLSLGMAKGHDYMMASQGYCIELNDMHGKSKGVFNYSEDGTLINKTEYKYLTKQGSNKQLSNKVKAINREGNIAEVSLGLEYDLVADMREHQTETTSDGFSANLDIIDVGATNPPVVIPMLLPAGAGGNTRFRSAVLTKVILRHGLLESVTVTDQGSTITTQNMLYDRITGGTLLTKVINQYEDPIYNLTMPAHWAYDRMGLACRNLNVFLTGEEAKLHPQDYFVLGDEVVLDRFVVRKPYKKWETGWVTQVSPLVITSRRGKKLKVHDAAKLKVVRSGRRNIPSLPIAKVVMMDNPMLGEQLAFSRVIDATAIEYSDVWGLYCGECGYSPDKAYNPFVAGTRGNWRAKRNYTFLTGRNQSTANKNTNTRKDGVYEYYSSFWKPNSSGYWIPDRDNWTFVSEVSAYSPYGVELENRDALNRYASALYGYNYTLPVAVGQNAMYAELAFDNFEDYDYENCNQHFSFNATNGNVVQTTGTASVDNNASHSGRWSMKLGGNASISTGRNLKKCR